MFRLISIFLAGTIWFPEIKADEIRLDFTKKKLGELPEVFSTSLLGKGDPANWEIIEKPAPSSVAKANSGNKNLAASRILSQTSSSHLRNGSPICLFKSNEFGDFTYSVRVRIDSGAFRQIAGIVFRAKDEKNFYALLINSIDKKIMLIKVVDGKQVPSWSSLGELNLPKNHWHTLSVVCKSDRISCYHNGVMINNGNPFSDSEQLKGKIGFITFRDTSASFAHPKIIYKPRIVLAQRLIETIKTKWGRIEDVQIYARSKSSEALKVAGSIDPKSLNIPASEVIIGVVKTAQFGYARKDKSVIVIAPLKDRNGEPVAAVKVTMHRFRGQTKKASIVRIMPIVKLIESRMRDAKDLLN